MLWITDPDAKIEKRAPKGPPLRGGSPWAYLIVAIVFAAVILLSIHVPWSTQKLVAGWVPGADVEGGFKGLLVVAAIVLRAKRVSRKLGVEPDLSVYEDASTA
jgi:hypothetical protein